VDASGVKTNEDHFRTVDLPEAAVRESCDRVRRALNNCGYDNPPTQSRLISRPPTPRKKVRVSACLWRSPFSALRGLDKKEIAEALFVGNSHSIAGCMESVGLCQS